MTEQTPAAEADQQTDDAVEEVTPEPAPAPAAELVRAPQPRSFLQRNRGAWDPANVAVIKQTVAKGANDAQLAVFLELSASLGLNPLAKEIWCAVQPGRNGGEPNVLIMVGRDGLLKKAREHSQPGYGRFLGMQDGVVCANDTFEVISDENGVHVTHRFDATKSADDGGRGEIVGAYARVIREGMYPTFFFAPLAEYLPTFDQDWKMKKSPWGNQRSAMILKCAQSTALRLAFSITGVVGEGEADRQLALEPGTVTTDSESEYRELLGADENEERARLLDQAMDLAGWLPAKRRARLVGLDDEGRDRLLTELNNALDAEAEVDGPPPEAEIVA